MGLDATVRSGIATAKKLTGALQQNVTLEQWTADGASGTPTYASGVTLPALIEHRQRLVRNAQGEEVMSQTTLTFLQPIAGNAAPNRRNPVDPRDRITLHDGTVGPIAAVIGLIDPSTSAPYMLEVALG